jgi:hypothetical protein
MNTEAVAAAAPSGPSNPSSVVSSAIRPLPPAPVNIGSISTNTYAPEIGLTPAQRCAAANADMETCLGSKEQIIAKIATLEKQALSAQCDQIRAQIAALRKQLATPVSVPAPRLTGPALRYGPTTRAGGPTIIATGAPAVCEKLPMLQSYATANGLVSSGNYKDKIKPLVNILSNNSRSTIKTLRDTLKSYDPPGTFTSLFGRKAKAKSGLTAVAGSVSTAIGCGGLRVEESLVSPSLPSKKPVLLPNASIGNIKFYNSNATKPLKGGARRTRKIRKHRKATRKQKYHRR